jgi:hypothetical protein
VNKEKKPKNLPMIFQSDLSLLFCAPTCYLKNFLQDGVDKNDVAPYKVR